MSDEIDNSIVPDLPTSMPLAIDDYSDFHLTEQAKFHLATIMMAAQAGTVALTPLICRGQECRFLSRCPIHLSDGAQAVFPLNKQCIVEVNFLNNRFASYSDELDKMGQMQNSITFRTQVGRLAALDLYEFRQHMILAGVTAESDGTLLIDQTIALTEAGDEVTQKQEHPSWKILTRIAKDRMELLDAMGLTVKRDAMIRAALHQKEADNFLTRSIEILERIADLEDAIVEDK